MTSTNILTFKEADVLRLVEGYLHSKGYHMTLDALERQTGILNSEYPEEVLLLRRFILNGKWREAVDCAKTFALRQEDLKFILFEITKQKYIELICVYEELKDELYHDLGSAISICFSELSSYCSCPVEYEHLKKLASLTKLSDDPNYKHWNLFTSRRQCFQAAISVLMEFPEQEAQYTESLIEPRRFMDLLVKGILYESVEDYCHRKVNNQSNTTTFEFSALSRPSEETASSSNLHAWIQTVPWKVMAIPFIHQSITVNVEDFKDSVSKEKWTEVILQNLSDPPKIDDTSGPQTPVQELKERFWNNKIENNLILDAPQILKKADDVIARWEKLNSLKCFSDTCNATHKVELNKISNDSIQIKRVRDKENYYATSPSSKGKHHEICQKKTYLKDVCGKKNDHIQQSVSKFSIKPGCNKILNATKLENEETVDGEMTSISYEKETSDNTSVNTSLTHDKSTGVFDDELKKREHPKRYFSDSDYLMRSKENKIKLARDLKQTVRSNCGFSDTEKRDPISIYLYDSTCHSDCTNPDTLLQPERGDSAKEEVYNSEQNVRDLLTAKETLRHKLLAILKGNNCSTGAADTEN